MAKFLSCQTVEMLWFIIRAIAHAKCLGQYDLFLENLPRRKASHWVGPRLWAGSAEMGLYSMYYVLYYSENQSVF